MTCSTTTTAARPTAGRAGRRWSGCTGCGRTGWRYLTVEGSGWRCWCGNHAPDDPIRVEAVTIELPDGQFALFDSGTP